MSFRRAEAPETTATEDLEQPKCFATRPMSSALALPSTGEDRRRAIHVPDVSASSELTAERGFARTVMTNELSPGDFVARRPAIAGARLTPQFSGGALTSVSLHFIPHCPLRLLVRSHVARYWALSSSYNLRQPNLVVRLLGAAVDSTERTAQW